MLLRERAVAIVSQNVWQAMIRTQHNVEIAIETEFNKGGPVKAASK